MPPATLQWFFFLAIVLMLNSRLFEHMELTLVDKISPTLLGILWNIINAYIYIYCILYIYILPHETCLLFHIIYYITQRIFTRKDVGHTVSNQLTFGLVSKWAIPQISALGSGTWWLLYNQWMTRGNVFGQTQVVMGHNHHGYPWIGMDSGFG